MPALIKASAMVSLGGEGGGGGVVLAQASASPGPGRSVCTFNGFRKKYFVTPHRRYALVSEYALTAERWQGLCSSSTSHLIQRLTHSFPASFLILINDGYITKEHSHSAQQHSPFPTTKVGPIALFAQKLKSTQHRIKPGLETPPVFLPLLL